ncbi:phosphatase PAP2 family protein [Empedobacter brevis]|nr:phosphatase PAP2 family protein [Empedobacter brevis]
MNQQKDLFLRIWPFFVVFFIYNFAAIAMTQYFGRDELHLHFNKYSSHYFDKFFVFYTDFGTYYLFFIVLAYLCWKHTKRMVLYLFLAESVASLISLFFKNVYFAQVLRPGYYFSQKKIDIVLVKDYAIQMASTFPSGHSLTASIIAMSLCLLTKNRWLQLFYALLFPSIAISRIYLSRHFAIDTVGGSFIGFFIFIFTYYIINYYNHPVLDQKFITNGKSE